MSNQNLYKKAISCGISFLIIVSLAACSNGSSDNRNESPVAESKATVEKDAITTDGQVEEKNTAEEQEAGEVETLQSQYEDYGLLEWIPRSGFIYHFDVYDEITSTEDLTSGADGTYMLIHFENSGKDTIILDTSRTTDGDNQADSDIIEETAKQIHQDGAAILSRSEPPKAGEFSSWLKASRAESVEDTFVTDEQYHYYVMKAACGLESLIAVPLEHIPSPEFSLYEYGEVVNGEYRNPTYEIRMPVTKEIWPFTPEIIKSEIIHTFGTYYEENCTFAENTMVYFITYEFVDNVEGEDVVAFLMEQDNDERVVGTSCSIAGKTYETLISTTDSLRFKTYYRVEGNKIYRIEVATFDSTCDEIVEQIENLE